MGREAELATLTALLDGAAAGRPQSAVLQGPAGIGKSRLADELLEIARTRGFRVGVGRAWPDGEAPDYWPWRAVLRDLGAPPPDAAGPGPGPFAQTTAILDALRAAADSAPLAIVLDDAQALDAASLRLAAFLARERALPLAQLLIRRSAPGGDGSRPLDDLEAHALVIELGGLSSSATAAFVGAIAGRPPDRAQLDVLAAVTHGNPLHLRTLAAQAALSADGLQPGLERALRDRIGRLAPADGRLLAVAALMGPEASAHEIARIAGAALADVTAALVRASDLGLIERSGDRAAFVHAAVRDAAVAAMPAGDRLAAHARAAAALTGHAPDVVARRAHHALAGAAGSAEAATHAVVVLRDAAATLKGTHGFEAAAGLLRRAVDLQAAVAPDAAAAPLAVEHAEAVLASGRLAEARPLFQAAARAADREGDAAALARAALGLGGMWISEHRLTSDAETARALQERALAGLPPDAVALRARLTARLAAEAAYRGGPVAAVLAALDAARRTADARTIAEALSLTHHALLTPEHVLRRLVLANEMIAAATDAGDELLALVGVGWRAADLFQLGHPRAPAALHELRVQAETFGCRSLQFVADAMAVMLAIRAGAFAQAERDAEACFALGREVGDADALAYHGAHLSAIRYFQGREAELAGLAASIAASPTLIEPRERSFATAAALFAARAGDPGPGRALLGDLAGAGLGSIPESSSWLTTVAAIAELALALDDVRTGQAAYDALLRHARVPVMASLAVVCFGSTHRPLGLAAIACGNLNLAITHLGAAAAANDALGHRPAAIVARAELGLTRLKRRTGDDELAGRTLVQTSIEEADRLGMTGLAGRWRQALSAFPRPGDPVVEVTMSRTGSGWRIAIDGQVATVPDRVGLRYLAQLVAAPGRGIPALALMLGGAEDVPENASDPVLDARALAEVRARIAELRESSDPSPDEENELEALTRELARATGLGGRLRRFADAPERARTAVRKALKRAIDDITAANPGVGRNLAGRIETGTVCCYHRAAPRPD